MRRACLLFCTVAASPVSFAGGFALIEEGASGLGNAYAGAAAVSRDASTVWFNPAGMTELKEKEFLAAGHVIGVNSEFTDQGTTRNLAFRNGAPLNPDFATSDPIDVGGTSFIPNLYYVHPLRYGITLGIGLSVPFGNSTDYDRDWVGRYQAVESGVTALDINPSIAYRVNEQVSIGGGISVQFLSASLGSAIDTDVVCLGALPIDACEASGLNESGTLENDGFADIEGDGVAVSFNIGALFKPVAGTKLGVAYRHGFEHELEGTAEFTTNPVLEGILQTGGSTLFADSDVTAEASLPPTVMFSGAYMANDRLELLADATYTGWSSFDELRVVFDNPVQPDTFNTLEYEDVWRVSAGFNYEFSDQLILRGGVALDQDPVPSTELRTARIPGNDRAWIAVGAGYKVNNRIGVDVGFAHLMIDDTPIANVSEAAGGTTIRGVFDTNANILSAQVTVQFD